MALTPQQITDIVTAFPQLGGLTPANNVNAGAASLAALKAQGQSIIDQAGTLAGQVNGLALAYPAYTAEINAAKAAFITALKAALGL